MGFGLGFELPSAHRGLVLGPELIVGGDFSSAAGWTLGTGWAISGGLATVTTPGAISSLSRPATIAIGKTYMLTIEVSAMTAAALVVRAYSGASPVFNFGANITVAGTYVRSVVAAASGDIFSIDGSAAAVASVNSVSLREVLA